MKPQFKVLSGARAGHTEVFSKANVVLGRHPEADLRFDAERDLRVSARHAEVYREKEHWFVRDLGSRNGTFVNGHRIAAPTKLDDTDQIRLGDADGPVVEVRLVPDGARDGVIAQARTPAAAAPGPRAARETAPSVTPPVGSTTERIRIEVGRQTRRLRAFTGVLFALLIAVAGTFFALNRKQTAERAREVAAMQARTDSLMRAAERSVEQLQGQVEGLASALRASQSQVSDLQTRLATAQRSGTPEQVDVLSRELADAAQALRYQQAAAQVDYRRIVDENQYAVAIVWVRFGPTETYTGTAFAVREDGVLLTNRHVVAGEDGTRRALEVAVQFAESRQVWRGRVLAVSPTVDLAILKVDIAGGTPTVQRLGGADDLRQGDPVAIIGFPLGTDLPMSSAGRQDYAKTSFTAGSVSKVLPDLLQIDGYGAQGASGSPIFDRAGNVVGVLYGGQAGTAGRIVYAVPASHAVALLRTIP